MKMAKEIHIVDDVYGLAICGNREDAYFIASKPETATCQKCKDLYALTPEQRLAAAVLYETAKELKRVT